MTLLAVLDTGRVSPVPAASGGTSWPHLPLPPWPGLGRSRRGHLGGVLCLFFSCASVPFSPTPGGEFFHGQPAFVGKRLGLRRAGPVVCGLAGRVLFPCISTTLSISEELRPEELREEYRALPCRSGTLTRAARSCSESVRVCREAPSPSLPAAGRASFSHTVLLVSLGAPGSAGSGPGQALTSRGPFGARRCPPARYWCEVLGSLAGAPCGQEPAWPRPWAWRRLPAESAQVCSARRAALAEVCVQGRSAALCVQPAWHLLTDAAGCVPQGRCPLSPAGRG